jgi:cell division initiation protein
MMLKLEATTDAAVKFAASSLSPATERPSTITPLDMRQTTFQPTWRGYSRQAVRTFLVDASESYELALRENERLRQEIERLQASLKQYQDLETGLKSTLVHAQKVADDVRATAAQEADRLVREAQGRAELLMMAAQNRLEDAQREIEGLKLRRREAEANVESIIASLHATLEFIRDQQREPRVVPLRPAI